jgi:hypothetical protein
MYDVVSVRERLLSKCVEVEGPLDTPCLVWTGSLVRGGYGKIWVDIVAQIKGGYSWSWIEPIEPPPPPPPPPFPRRF